MTKAISELIRSMKDRFDALERIASWDDLLAGRFPESEATREIIASQLDRLLDEGRRLREALQDASTSEKALLSGLRDADYEAYRRVIEPRLSALSAVWINAVFGGRLMLDPAADVEIDNSDAPVLRTIHAALEFYDGTVEECDERRDEEFDFDGAHRVTSVPLFRPDQWLRNWAHLRPVLLNRRAERFPKEVRQLLSSAQNAYAFGNWLGVVAIARSVLEYMLRDVLQEPSQSRDGMNLEQLIDEAARKIPGLPVDELHHLRQQGNRVMHPPGAGRREEVASLPVAEGVAGRALNALLNTAEALYRTDQR